MRGLTGRQQEVLEFIIEMMKSSQPPTIREIATRLGIGSANGAVFHVKALVRKGYVEVIPNVARGIRALKRPNGQPFRLDRQTSATTKAALRELKDKGVQLGGEALGWRRTNAVNIDGRRVLEKVPAEIATARRVFKLRSQGLTLKAIAEQLNTEGRPTKRGGRWYQSTVRAILQRKRP